MVKLLIQKRRLGDKSICIQMNTISCLFHMQMQQRRCLMSMRVCLCMCGGAVLGSSSWAACERCTRRPTEHFKKQKERESELSGQGRRWAELIPEETRILGENFITVTFPSATHTWKQQEGRLFVLPSHLEYNYRRQLWGGAVEVDGANPRVKDAVSNRFLKKKSKHLAALVFLYH